MKSYLEMELPEIQDETDARFYSTVEKLATQMQEFSDQVNSIKPLLEKRFLEKGTDTLKKERLFDAPTTRACDEEVKLIFTSTNGLAVQIRSTLKNLQDIVNSTEDGGKKHVYDTTIAGIYHRFKGQLERYHQMQLDYDRKSKDRLFREAKILMPEASDDELQQAVESGQVQTLAYDKIMMNDQKHIEARTALALLQEQQQELLSLETSINELHSLFLEVTSLLKSQEDPLLKLQEDTEPVRKHVRAALQDLREGEHDVRDRRRRKIIFWSTVTGTALVGAAITIAPLFAFA
eukprot:TRINITY_DN10494_c0_g1_i1.p1 TRINITY_DN10494_c0_g1~~TRINITY_DN10494_c0_g1_i1.p1  ORF type:complete len:292 (-),score=71.26 TRINITY_DN10494_c0_g1_i1:127-1002(-)